MRAKNSQGRLMRLFRISYEAKKNVLGFFASGVFLIICSVLLCGCATGNKGYSYHCFDFDTHKDSPEIDILDYKYGDCNPYIFGICATPYRVAEGGPFRQFSTCGVYPRAKSLYVKWRIKESGKIYEDLVNLDKLLPANMTKYSVRLVIRNEQVFIYLLPPPGDWMAVSLAKPITERESAWTRKFIIYPEKPTFFPDTIKE